MVCKIVEESFEPFATLEKCPKEIFVNGAKVGANAIFVGTMRDFNDGESVESLFLEHYPEMAEKVLVLAAKALPVAKALAEKALPVEKGMDGRKRDGK